MDALVCGVSFAIFAADSKMLNRLCGSALVACALKTMQMQYHPDADF
jgi:hypothetical protein